MLLPEKTLDMMQSCLEEHPSKNVVVIAEGINQSLTRFANSQIHQNVAETSIVFTITAGSSGRNNTVVTNARDRDELNAAILSASEALRDLPVSGNNSPGLVTEPEEIVHRQYSPELLESFDTHARAELLLEGLKSVGRTDQSHGNLTYTEQFVAFANSNGIRRLAHANAASTACLIVGRHGGSGYAKAPLSVVNPESVCGVFSAAAKKANLNRNPRKVRLGTHTVILEPLATAQLIHGLARMGWDAPSVRDGRSFLSGLEGKQIFAQDINLSDNWSDPGVVGLPFDFEGSPRVAVPLVENGIAKAFLHDRCEGSPTGHTFMLFPPQYETAALNLVMDPGEASQTDMIASTDEGLLITRFHYMNPVSRSGAEYTGLTRDGVFRIHRGEVIGAVTNMRFTDSLLAAFQSVTAVGRHRERSELFDRQRIGIFGNHFTPAVKMEALDFTGYTEA